MKVYPRPARQTAVDFAEFIWIWNQIQGQQTPIIHYQMARWLNSRWQRRDKHLLLMAFRAAGKSTIIGLFCAWVLYCNPDLRILVLAAEQTLAVKMVRQVKRVMERHLLTRGLKPPRADQWASDRFTLERSKELRDASMLAKGIQANITGSRADMVICDDVEVPNTCDTAPKRADLRQRLSEIDYILTPGGVQLYAGTPHSYFTIYADVARKEAGETAPFLAGFKRLKIPICNAKGEAAWPERFGLSAIADLKRRQGPDKFKSQMMLEPASITGGRLDLQRLGSYTEELVHEARNGVDMLLLGPQRLISANCWWDPAYGSPSYGTPACGNSTYGNPPYENPRQGDRSVIACVYTDERGAYWLHRVAYMKTDPGLELDAARQQCHQVLQFVRGFYLPSVTIETNGIGKFLPGLLRAVFRQNGCATAVLEHHATINKDRRLMEAFDAVLAAGQLKAHQSVWQTPFIAEMREWRPGKTGPSADDGLDAVAGCLLSAPVTLSRHMFEHMPIKQARKPLAWQGLGQQHQAQTEFEIS